MAYVDFTKAFKGITKDIKKNRLPAAQYWLDNEIMNHMLPFMPLVTGTFQNLTRMRSASLAGSGVVCAATGVYGRYLYEGKKMIDAATGKGPAKIPIGGGEYILRYRKGAKLRPTEEPLRYTNPMARPHWFDEAKAAHYQDWCDGVRRILTDG